jgi:hypothetical protein
MKREFAIAVSTVSVALLFPAVALAKSSSSAQTEDSEDTQLVSAHVALNQDIDADRMRQGDPIRTVLSDKVHLQDGIELPAGTAILGVIATDDMKSEGTSKLALDFTQAELKDGTVVPFKATMLGVYPPESEDAQGHPLKPGDQVDNHWTQYPDGVDEIGALPGVNLYSRLSDDTSGVLVSTTKHDMKLKRGSEIALVVVPQAA